MALPTPQYPNPVAGSVSGTTPGPGAGGIGGGQAGLGSVFRSLAPGANITPPNVQMPNRGDFGVPGAAPAIAPPNRGDYGLNPADQARSLDAIKQTGAAARTALGEYNNPTGSAAFKNIMNYAEETTGAQESEAARHAADVAQRRGYAGGYEDDARATRASKMEALASAGFAGADQVRQEAGAQYGRAIGAYSQVLDSYNQAQATGNTAFAHDLTTTHIAQAEDALKTLSLNQDQQLAYAKSLQDAKDLQAQLLEQYNKDKIDNARFIQGNAQIAAQLFGELASLREKAREFDVGANQFEETRADAKENRNIGLRAAGRGETGAPLNADTGNPLSPAWTGLA